MKKLELKQIIKEEVRRVLKEDSQKELPTVFNATLARIGGSTNNFIDLNQLRSIFKENPDLVNDHDIKSIATEIVRTQHEWAQIEDKWAEKGRGLRDKAIKIFHNKGHKI